MTFYKAIKDETMPTTHHTPQNQFRNTDNHGNFHCWPIMSARPTCYCRGLAKIYVKLKSVCTGFSEMMEVSGSSPFLQASIELLQSWCWRNVSVWTFRHKQTNSHTSFFSRLDKKCENRQSCKDKFSPSHLKLLPPLLFIFTAECH